MIRKQNMAGMIQMFEEKLKRYEAKLQLNPESIAYKAMVKNTRDYLQELYEEGKIEASQNLALTI
jgi:hypothetical protein